MASTVTKTYEISTNEGLLRIDIPEDWKVTFGPLAVGAKGYSGGQLALRIYESDTKQRAIFTDVKSFRDLSIPVKRQYVKHSGSDEWESDFNGSSRNSKTVVEREWRNETND